MSSPEIPTAWWISARQRTLAAAALGVLAALIAMWFAPWQLSTLVAWDVTALSLLLSVWLSVGRFDPEQTRAFATREDNSRVAMQLLLLVASVTSLIGVAFDLVKANQTDGTETVVLTVIGVLTIVLSWAVVHTVFALRYAHEYYTPPIGGIDFKNDAAPDYWDFAYVAFTIGMTFQVSDTDIQARPIRRTALRHALVSYLFGAVILAVTINVVAGLVK